MDEKTAAEIALHTSRRHKTQDVRMLLAKHQRKSLPEQAKVLLNTGYTKNEIAKLLDLRSGDIDALLRNDVYPYIKNQWNQYFH